MEDEESVMMLGCLGAEFLLPFIKVGLVAAALYALLSILGLWPL